MMRHALADGQFAKVFIERDKYSLLPVCLGQDILIARILGKVADPQRIMTGGQKIALGSTPDAGIEQDLHAADSIFSGSIRSPATRRRA
jgi:anthranilate/para-aminobenzoate synthase component II